MDLSYVVNQVNTNNPQVSSGAFHFGKSKPLRFTITDRTHQAFGGICVTPNDEMYAVFRAGYTHGVRADGVPTDGIGGDIYYAKSTDYGNTWGTPVLLMSAPTGRDYRDSTLSYDELTNAYYFVYTDVSIDYKNGTRELHIMRSSAPFTNMQEVTTVTLPFDLMNQTFHTVVRNGHYLYLTCYGRNAADTTWNTSLLRSSNGWTWEIVKTWTANGDNECTVFFTPQSTGVVRINMLFRGGDDACSLSYSDDAGVTWSAKQPLGFDAAGGLTVFNVNNIYMLVARDQALGANHAYTYAMFSKDGINWSHRQRIGDAGPGYPTLVKTNNGRCFLGYSEEASTRGRMLIKELLNVPSSNELT